MPPEHLLADFVRACATNGAVFVIRGAQRTASSDFGLLTQRDVLAFIANGGLEKPRFINKALWRNNPDPRSPVFIDEYEFFSGRAFGYIAFGFQQKTMKWIIKSFKKNQNPDPRAFTLAQKLLKAWPSL